MARAEVIHGYLQPDVAQTLEDRDCVVNILHDRVLCNLERQAIRRDVLFFQQLQNVVGQILVLKVTRGQVYRNAKFMSGLLPLATLPDGGGQNESREVHDGARIGTVNVW